MLKLCDIRLIGCKKNVLTKAKTVRASKLLTLPLGCQDVHFSNKRVFSFYFQQCENQDIPLKSLSIFMLPINSFQTGYSI